MVTNDFIVDIANTDGQLQLNVTDRKTGKTSTIQVSGLQSNSTDTFEQHQNKDNDHAALPDICCSVLIERLFNCST
jgi:hypothetical protein